MELKVKTVRYFKSLASLHEKLIADPTEATSTPSDEAKERRPAFCLTASLALAKSATWVLGA
jgi:hypothetical protein